MSELCKKCAECCRKFPYIEISTKDIATLKKATGIRADEFTNPKDKAGSAYFLKFKENGSCVFLIEADGCYSCGVYESRPGICRSYPSKSIHRDFCEKVTEKIDADLTV